MKQTWYSARLLFESLHRLSKEPPFFEEKWAVFRAASHDDAATKVKKVGKKFEHAYENAKGNMVHVKFREVLEVQEILDDQIRDGTEVFFRFWSKPTLQQLALLRETQEQPWWRTRNRKRKRDK